MDWSREDENETTIVKYNIGENKESIIMMG